MIASDTYNRIFEYSSPIPTAWSVTDPQEIEKSAPSREVAAWELLLGSMQLRRGGQRSPANDWLNHASRLSVNHPVFKAELLGEAGQGLFEGGRLKDACEILNSATATWRDACTEAMEASKGSKKMAAAEFASHLLPLFAAGRTKAPASESEIRSGTLAVTMVQQWLDQRGVFGRAQTANSFLRVLAKAGQIENARRILGEEMEWVAVNFTSPPKPVYAHVLHQRVMSRTTRRALYLLLLAQGEVELAAESFERSAEGFRMAAAIFENKVEDESDTSRLLRAKVNEANSLLRLKRIKEALDIYKLCKHGFNSIHDVESAQRVDHAIVFAHTLASDEDES